MKTKQINVTIRELVQGYFEEGEVGVKGLDGRLDIRPPYQRSFVYKETQRNAVVKSVRNNRPLNLIYWAVRSDGTYEVIDGQQRTISLCRYVKGVFSVDKKFFHNLTYEQQEEFLNYPLMVYVCEGTENEKLEWFETINIAGVVLKKQELRNAVYYGSWLASAKKYFSSQDTRDYFADLLKGAYNRQDYLETALKWASKNNIEGYMASHQHKPNALELWNYMTGLVSWVNEVFPEVHGGLRKGVDWGSLYDKFGSADLDPQALDAEIAQLLLDDEVTKKAGIYPYVLTRDTKYLNLRAFTESMRRAAYERQKGICPLCGGTFDAMEADHIVPWSEGGKTTSSNLQMLCRECNRKKSNK